MQTEGKAVKKRWAALMAKGKKLKIKEEKCKKQITATQDKVKDENNKIDKKNAFAVGEGVKNENKRQMKTKSK